MAVRLIKNKFELGFIILFFENKGKYNMLFNNKQICLSEAAVQHFLLPNFELYRMLPNIKAGVVAGTDSFSLAHCFQNFSQKTPCSYRDFYYSLIYTPSEIATLLHSMM
jgi:hypothetical protein